VEASSSIALKDLAVSRPRMTELLEQTLLFKSCEIYKKLGMFDEAAEVLKKIQGLNKPVSSASVPVEWVDTSDATAASQEPSPRSGTGSDDFCSVHTT
jgi:hypothetical protein